MATFFPSAGNRGWMWIRCLLSTSHPYQPHVYLCVAMHRSQGPGLGVQYVGLPGPCWLCHMADFQTVLLAASKSAVWYLQYHTAFMHVGVKALNDVLVNSIDLF